MPFYDYRCTECGHEEVDVRRNMSENVSTYVCPKCEGQMKQIIRVFGFELKGTGWFKDSYATKGKKDGTTEKS